MVVVFSNMQIIFLVVIHQLCKWLFSELCFMLLY